MSTFSCSGIRAVSRRRGPVLRIAYSSCGRVPRLAVPTRSCDIEEFGAARAGREAVAENARAQAAGVLQATPDQLADAMLPHLSAVDANALTGELAEFLLDAMRKGLEHGFEGWIDDDLAFLSPWASTSTRSGCRCSCCRASR